MCFPQAVRTSQRSTRTSHIAAATPVPEDKSTKPPSMHMLSNPDNVVVLPFVGGALHCWKHLERLTNAASHLDPSDAQRMEEVISPLSWGGYAIHSPHAYHRVGGLHVNLSPVPKAPEKDVWESDIFDYVFKV